MDRTIDVRTPESIAFSYELAGLGSRFLALALDQLIQLATLLAIVVGAVLALQHVPPAQRMHVLSSGEAKVVRSIALAIVVVVVFAVFFGYFIVFEALWNGQTPGKRLLGIRVVRDGGYPIDFGASLIRNLIRVGEATLGYYLLSMVSALLSSENKRLGDLAAGTIVVRDARLAVPQLNARATEPVYSPTAYLSGEERSLIKRFLDRRDELSRERRAILAGQLADRIRDRVPPELARLDSESLLERL
ncbi:MAG: RDD family protein [Candidatus Eremiobacteraeota bacterium]|nr:RDD family protein [Candidatus Eremiobacteraeota bacterium]MBV9057386.1 RDD family protein [Candidatus Eremiobacteraeota bacterium]MBV9700091.1 RDD family protein [Candidatus Eremiobacteraeota bacterium]